MRKSQVKGVTLCTCTLTLVVQEKEMSTLILLINFLEFTDGSLWMVYSLVVRARGLEY